MFKTLTHKAYEVGGCVRDRLLGLEPSDVDYVIEAHPETIEAVFPEAEKVGNSFPVYIIHGCEVAATRVEFSTGAGYRDFNIDLGVSIEEDLGRRDFTINSIAMNVATGELIDPFGGLQDLENRILRCINPHAFEEDPLRIYRAARFAARYNLEVEPYTLRQIQSCASLLRHVNAERVEAELRKVYKQCPYPSDFFYHLNEFSALGIHFMPLVDLGLVPAGPHEHHGDNTGFDHTMEAIDRCDPEQHSFEVFVAVLCHDFGKGRTPAHILPHHYGHEDTGVGVVREFLKQHRFGHHAQALALCVVKNHMRMQILDRMRTVKQVRFVRSIRKEMRDEFFQACNCDHPLGSKAELFHRVRAAVETHIDPALISGFKGEALRHRVEQLYVKALLGHK